MFVLLFACVTQEPSYVSREDLTKAYGQGDTTTLCAGLRMADSDVRSEAAGKLKDYGIDTDCLCERLQFDGRWDPSIVGALKGAKDAEKVGCAGALLDDTKQPDRPALATTLLKVPAVRARLLDAAASDADPAVRAAAMGVFRSSKDAGEVTRVAGWLASDPSPVVRAAAAEALYSQASGIDALRAAARGDADASVRAAALTTLHAKESPDFDDVVCGALLEDTAPEVRVAAIGTLRATKDPERLACMRKRAATREDAPEVRSALLASLAANSAPEAAAILCDTIPYWVKTYVGDTAPAEGDDILRAQNDRDFERTYDCAQAAMRGASGYTCAGRAYVAAFFRDQGGKVGVPTCGAGRPSSAPREITF